MFSLISGIEEHYGKTLQLKTTDTPHFDVIGTNLEQDIPSILFYHVKEIQIQFFFLQSLCQKIQHAPALGFIRVF